MQSRVLAALVLVVAALMAVTIYVRRHPSAPPVDATYASRVQPLFDRRCIVCHSCYDSPCQLNLQSFEGVDRGGNKIPVYEPNRVESVRPTRMFVDAQTTSAWQTGYDFFPVIERAGSPDARASESLLLRLVAQRRANGAPETADVDSSRTCPRSRDELERELSSDPAKGMPYGMPALTDDELHVLSDWVRAGSGRPEEPAAPAASDAIAKWERFLNDDGTKSRIVARYLYEHLFLAHVYFENAPGEWYRLVRSRAAAPASIDEIATVRPYDDPKVARVFYRLRPLRETIVEKTHIPFQLSDAKLARFKELFLDSDWGDAKLELPSYEPAIAANPFVAFKSIPARARYQYMLDDAQYHVKTFIHGPVCKGQVALDVIDEHFLIFFLSPKADLSITDPAYLAQVAPELRIPAEGGNSLAAVYERFKADELAYLTTQALLAKKDDAPGRALTDVWDGDGTNPNAVLTVYRHFDSAFVSQGATGGVPRTAWVMDYPIFERMYYDLVAGFDVFGNLIHQSSTRRYMNLLRLESENGLLVFLPAAQRKVVRDSWYRGAGVAMFVDAADPLFNAPETRIAYAHPEDAKRELIVDLVTKVLPPAVVGERDPIQWTDVPIEGADARARFERAARGVAATPAPFVQWFGDSSLVRVASPEEGDLAFSIVRNRAHENIDFMFLEKAFLDPANDTLHVVRGIVTSRPNFFFDVAAGDEERFFADMKALTSDKATWTRFVDRYGARRTDRKVWEASDFFNSKFPKLDPVVAGVLDLSRYSND